MEDGVWRTIGGRRIFIKEGESLTSAMKRSGKFSVKERVQKATEEYNQARDEQLKRRDEELKNEQKEKEKYMNLSQEEREAQEKAKWFEENKGKEYASHEANVKSQKNDIEEASGLKVEKAFQTDAWGTGKEDRFQLEDGRYIAHSTESMGQKEDKWSINKVEGGKINTQEFNSYDSMIKNLSNSEPYKKAFNEYKKKHPNSKITLSKFIDMSEGK